jgi:glycerol-3-phosphate O-acyltransferase/dihydroxyacetone phosphate acyltransferase
MPYFERVLEADEGSRRAAVKLLTNTIETRLVELTINAPDWLVTPEGYLRVLPV